MKEPNKDAYSADLTKRLNQVLEGISQREFASRLGIPNQSLSRYLRGTLPPAWIYCRLVKEFGVNPSWLLAGEGAPKLTDVHSGTIEIAGELLELVQALRSITKMRIGELGGNTTHSVLRELNDSLSDYTQLKHRLNSKITPIFEHILKDLRPAVIDQSTEESEALINAGNQIATLCNSDNLNRDFAFFQSVHHYNLGDLENFMRFQKEALRLNTTSDTEIDESTWYRVGDFVAGLYSRWRIADAYSLSEAYLGLSRTSQAPAAAIDHIEAWLGFLEIEMGRLELGRLRLKQAYHRSQEWSEADFKRWPKRRELLQHLIKSLWHFSLFYDGSIDFWDLYNTPLMQIYKGAVASLAVCWTRDEKALRATMELHQSQASKGESHTSNDMGYRWLKPLIEALRGKTNKKPESLKKRPKLEFSPNLLDSVMEAETFVIAKKNTLAKKALLKNEASMGALHGAPSPLVIRAVHYRNVLEVFQKTTTKAEQQVYENAQTFFRIHKNAGYRFLDTSHF